METLISIFILFVYYIVLPILIITSMTAVLLLMSMLIKLAYEYIKFDVLYDYMTKNGYFLKVNGYKRQWKKGIN